MVKPGHLDLLRKRQRQAHAAVLRAEKSRKGGLKAARRGFVLATAELLRATLAAAEAEPGPEPA